MRDVNSSRGSHRKTEKLFKRNFRSGGERVKAYRECGESVNKPEYQRRLFKGEEREGSKRKKLIGCRPW